MTLKIRYASDLHVGINTKHYGMTNVEIMQSLNLYDIDVLILAGDTDEYPKNLHFIDYVSSHYPKLKIIEVGGNHLYYSGLLLHMDIKEINKYCKKHNEVNPNYYFLENNTVTIDNVKFIGSTMWTKLGEYFGIQMKCMNALNDFRYILGEYPHTLTAKNCRIMHEKARKFITKEVNSTPEYMECIVITHHAPFLDRIDDISHAFGIDLTKTIKRFKKCPKAWVYGHTHINKNITGKTKYDDFPIICNQYGYEGECEYDSQFNAWKTFDSNKKLEV